MRKALMTSTLYERQPRLPKRSTYTRVMCVMVALGGSLAAACLSMTQAKASNNYCTLDNPSAPYNSICTGNGTWCNLGMQYVCSPIPGMPGTWNPRGYTPSGTDATYPLLP
jgi:hypothetical protein